MWKKYILPVLKFGFAFGIIAYLILSGKLSLSDLGAFLKNPLALFLTALMIFSTFLLSFYRWKILLKGQGIFMKYWDCFRLGMLGQFFSAVIPGTVGGDLVKGVFVARRFPKKRASAISTIVLDRVIGLVGMIVLGGSAFLIGFKKINALPGAEAHVIILLGWGLCGMALAFLCGFLLFGWLGKKLPEAAPSWIVNFPVIGKHFAQLYAVAVRYRECPQYLWLSLGVSIVSHACNMTAMFVVTRAIHGPQPWGELEGFSLIVASILGMCAMAIPIAPVGLGVGQLAFGRIFYALGAPTASFGILVVSGFQIIMILLNFCGSVFFATYKHEVQESGLASAVT